jgi:hypothetical protein
MEKEEEEKKSEFELYRGREPRRDDDEDGHNDGDKKE